MLTVWEDDMQGVPEWVFEEKEELSVLQKRQRIQTNREVPEKHNGPDDVHLQNGSMQTQK